MRVAIVCDWLTGLGGAERVVLELHRMFPEAPIYTSQYDSVAVEGFEGADVRTLWLQKLPKALKKFLPMLRAQAFSHLDLSEYDLVISSSGAEAKAVKTGPNTVHICYCHSPTHYYWSRYDAYMAHPGFGLLDPIARLGLRLLVGRMREWDYQAAQNPDYFIVNSKHTAAELKKYYGREAEVIHPPVDIERFKPKDKIVEKHGFVTAGRQTPYKRIDLAVAACTELDVPLKVIGDGPDHNKLVKMAGARVSFLTNVSDSEIPRHFQQAEAFIFPGIDDFGIVAVEALAAGTPVIAYGAGGALDYVKPSKTGLIFNEHTAESLVEALRNFRSKRFKATDLLDTASRFSPGTFSTNLSHFIENLPK
jgi:glycosyltransferase involved in cell wall biosynthesis